MSLRIATIAMAASLLAGCSGGSWNPWSKSPGGGEAAVPAGATAYTCDGGKRLFVRFQSDGKSAWIVHPDREFRLDRVAAASGEQFTNGKTLLAVKPGEAMLMEGTMIQFAGCKVEPGSR